MQNANEHAWKNLPLVSREWKNGSNSSYNCTPFLHSLLTKGKKIHRPFHTMTVLGTLTRAIAVCSCPYVTSSGEVRGEVGPLMNIEPSSTRSCKQSSLR